MFDSRLNAVLAFCLLLMCAVSHTLYSAPQVVRDGNMYKVLSVGVDVTADSASKAKELAINQGQALAFATLLDEIIGTDSFDRGALNSEEFIEDFAVNTEKFSNHRFIASLTYNFNASSLQQKIATFGVVPLSLTSRFIILPVVVEHNDTKLWNEDNQWFDAWKQYIEKSKIQYLIAPVGDLEDLTSLKEFDIAEHNYAKIQQLAYKYNANGAIVAVMNENNLTVYAVQNARMHSIDVVVIPDNQDAQKRLRDAIHLISGKVKSHIKNFSIDKKQHLVVTMDVSSVTDVMQLENLFKQVQLIESVETVNLSNRSVTLKLIYGSDLEALQKALSFRGLHLSQGSNNSWQIIRKEAL